MLVGFQQITLQPGQFIFGRQQAAADLNLTERQVRTCLERLKSTGTLTVKTTNRFSIVSVVNWHIYQAVPDDIDQQTDQQTDQHATSTRPARDHKQEQRTKDVQKTPPPAMTLSGFRKRYRECLGMELGGGVNEAVSKACREYTAEAIEQAIIAASTRSPRPTNPFSYIIKILKGEPLLGPTPPVSSPDGHASVVVMDPERAARIKRTMELYK